MRIEKEGKLPDFTGHCSFCRSWVSVSPGDKEYKLINLGCKLPDIVVKCPTKGCGKEIWLTPSHPEDYMPRQYELNPR